jgi:hypothetical protein
MIAPRFITTFLLSVVVTGCSAATEDDSMLMLKGEGMGGGVMYVWEIPRSSIAALPRWDPVGGEAPLSPHRAAAAATEFLRNRFGPSVQLTIFSLCLGQSAIRPGGAEAPGAQVWDYQISFECEPEPPPAERPMLNVLVLMDGKVVVPVAKPDK